MSEFENRVLEKLTDIQVEVAKQSEKQIATHNIVEKLDDKVDKQNGRVKTNEDDISGLKSWRSMLIGGWTMLVIGLGLWAKWG